MRCHYHWDKETNKKYLIPGCWSVVFMFHLDDEVLLKEFCTCEKTYKEFMRKEYNDTVKELKADIKYLMEENERLIAILEKHNPPLI